MWVEQRNVLVQDKAGRLVAIEGIARDVTERTQAADAIRRLNEELEQRVRARTIELEAANKELEAFSYSISHDLRAPLRAVNAFSSILLQDHGPQMPEQAQHLLRHVSTSARHMEQLIEDLLNFSRLGRQPLATRSVNLTSIVQHVLDELQKEREDRHVEVRVGRLPECVGDPALLKQVVVNLLSNAFKFTRQRDHAIIEVGCWEHPEEGVYFVRDNGVGFDMKYVQKLFGVFQRLHRADEFEGTGIGLSIVQRIIHRHGGRAWAEGKVGEGAIFYFSLPKRNPSPPPSAST